MTRRHARQAPLEAVLRDAVTAETPSTGVAVVTRRQAAGALVAPARRKILSLLQTPGSATTVAARIGLSRQLVNYHIRALESAGLVEEVDRRQRRGLEERVVRATAAHYLLSPDALGLAGPGPREIADTFSATYQVAVAARTIREVADLAELARQAGKRLTTLTLDTEVRFASLGDREAFANELVEAVTGLVAKYHDGQSPDGRTYRVFLGAHPTASAPAKKPRASRRDRTRDRRER